MKIKNRKASFNYQILDKFEAGMALNGAEVKSIKNGHLKLEESFVRFKDNEAWLFNAHVHPYAFSKNKDYNPLRPKKLLLHKKELLKLRQNLEQKNLTIVPILCYIKHNKVKLEVALARGKKKYEKRESIKKKDLQREVESKIKL